MSYQSNLRWDERISEDIHKPWLRWIRSLETDTISFPGSAIKENGTAITLHRYFGCKRVISLCRVTLKVLLIPRLQLVAAHMLSKLVANTKEGLERVQLIKERYKMLYWLQQKRTWSILYEIERKQNAI